jgi:hypothetical protein
MACAKWEVAENNIARSCGTLGSLNGALEAQGRLLTFSIQDESLWLSGRAVRRASKVIG